ncbi:MAG: PhnD/SsuA/transferrin family substrate-binding protein [Verrucomicrobia bacterium]|nr:PhnD/SsuA/transferrin family substrate-binding protein [Verrucomicrobiota bacterium]
MNYRNIVVGAAVFCSVATGFAGPRDVMVFYPGAPGSPEEAKDVMAGFGAYLAKAAGLPEGALKVVYENDLETGLGDIAKNKPGFAIVGLPVYLGHGAKLKMKLLAQTVPANRKTDGYYIVGRTDGPANLAAAKGLKLSSNQFYDKVFVSRIVLGGQDVEAFFKLKEVGSGLRAIKAVAGEEKKADLALLDQNQFDALPALPLAAQLRVVHKSPSLPPAPAVFFEGVAAEADIAAIKKALFGMGADATVKELLQTMTLKGFVAPDGAAYDAAQKLYNK